MKKEKTPLLVICGPTASGKTALAIHMAKRFDGEVVSADSMQVYRRMDIGTAKPSAAERDGIPHHLLDTVDPEDNFSLVQYLQSAKETVEDIGRRGRLPILAGGTGLYIHSLVDNIQFSEIASDSGVRRELEQMAQEKGAQFLWEQLRDCDPELADKLHPNNQGRIVRALEVYRLTGVTMTELQRRSRLEPSPYCLCMLGLCFRDRQTLYRRIDLRVDEMLRQGLVDEARSIRSGCSKTAAQAIGYKEMFAYFDGECTLEEAVVLIKQRSRNYAKRQMTWFRRDGRIRWLPWEDYAGAQELFLAAEHIVEGETFTDPLEKGW